MSLSNIRSRCGYALLRCARSLCIQSVRRSETGVNESPENDGGNTTAVGDNSASEDYNSQFKGVMSQINQLDLDVDRYRDLNSQCNIVSEQIKKLREDVKALRNENYKLRSKIESIKGNKKILQEMSELYTIDWGVLNHDEMRSIERDVSQFHKEQEKIMRECTNKTNVSSYSLEIDAIHLTTGSNATTPENRHENDDDLESQLGSLIDRHKSLQGEHEKLCDEKILLCKKNEDLKAQLEIVCNEEKSNGFSEPRPMPGDSPPHELYCAADDHASQERYAALKQEELTHLINVFSEPNLKLVTQLHSNGLISDEQLHNIKSYQESGGDLNNLERNTIDRFVGLKTHILNLGISELELLQVKIEELYYDAIDSYIDNFNKPKDEIEEDKSFKLKVEAIQKEFSRIKFKFAFVKNHPRFDSYCTLINLKLDLLQGSQSDIARAFIPDFDPKLDQHLNYISKLEHLKVQLEFFLNGEGLKTYGIFGLHEPFNELFDKLFNIEFSSIYDNQKQNVLELVEFLENLSIFYGKKVDHMESGGSPDLAFFSDTPRLVMKLMKDFNFRDLINQDARFSRDLQEYNKKFKDVLQKDILKMPPIE